MLFVLARYVFLLSWTVSRLVWVGIFFVADRLSGTLFVGIQLNILKLEKVLEETVTLYYKSNLETPAHNRVSSAI